MERILAALGVPARTRALERVAGPATPDHRDYLLKRPLDLLLASTMLVLSAPLFVLIALAIKLDDGGPIFFRQERWARGGLRFHVRKFRSMRVATGESAVVRPATVNDDRCTRVGRLLRASALDELPQLLCVLQGHMSFVGPRPLAVGESRPDGVPGLVEDVPGFFERLAVKPGLTSLATVYVPKDSPPRRKFLYDLLYVRRRSLMVDLRLVAVSVLISLVGRWESRTSKLAGLSPSRRARVGEVVELGSRRPEQAPELAPATALHPTIDDLRRARTYRRAAAVTLLVGGLLGLPQSTLAQDEALAQDGSVTGTQARDDLSAQVQTLLSADLRWGPFFLKPGLGLGSGVESVPIRGQDRAEAEIVGDAVAKIAPRLDVVLPFRSRHEFRVSGRVEYNWYYRFEELRNFDKFLLARYEYDNEDLRFRAWNDYRDTQTSFLDYVGDGGGASDPQYDLDQRNKLRENDTAARLEWNLGHRTTAEFRGGLKTYRFDDAPLTGDSLSESLDRNVASIGTTGELQLLPRTRVGVSYDYMSADFTAIESFRDHKIHRVAGLVTFDRSAPIFGTVRLGFASLSPTMADRLGFSGIVARGDLNVRASSRVLVTVEGSRDVTPTYWPDNIYAEAARMGAKVEIPLTGVFSIRGDVAFTGLDYPVPVTAKQFDGSILTAARRDNINSYGATLVWARDSRETYNIRIGYYDRGSNFDGQSIDGWTIRTSIKFDR